MTNGIIARELARTTASLVVAAARERGTVLVFVEEARRILAQFPDTGLTEPELAIEMERAFGQAT